ncbi:MAG: hypothetical protein KKH41_08595 [Candidatus Thermoplasmatota archaeon]|nr:hypothetical protein [Euryarchaeota archaeon]MBU4031199.1 hypothetical protein [Candidatus Thermoplasmatota archaeon]MBU4070605.1 hypothetical protein [Candidatus Thermoplasmatota archaeon]MBU4143432.1 hypothetical protein [Candidatus Thermoplasmatota archaeon]MBU4592622.1 hypothetical protein [Candidatus Thermoplasmatota archaeon]
MEERKYSLPFDANIASKQQRLVEQLKNFNAIIMPIGFAIAIIAIANLYDAIMYPQSNNIMGALLSDPRIWISIPGIIFLLFLYKFRKIPFNLIRTYYPQRVLQFFELYPRMEGTNSKRDVLYRALYSTGTQPSYNSNGGLSHPSRRIMNVIKEQYKYHETIHKKNIKKNKKGFMFDFTMVSPTSHDWILVFTIIGIPSMIFIMCLDAFLQITNIEVLSDAFCLTGVIIYFILMFYIGGKITSLYGEVIIIKQFTKELTIDNVKAFISAVQKRTRKINPSISILHTDQPVSPDVLEFIRSKEGHIHGKFAITLIKETNNRYEVLWTG